MSQNKRIHKILQRWFNYSTWIGNTSTINHIISAKAGNMCSHQLQIEYVIGDTTYIDRNGKECVRDSVDRAHQQQSANSRGNIKFLHNKLKRRLFQDQKSNV